MLVNLNDVLIPARRGKYAVGLFNTVNLELARGVMEAAEELEQAEESREFPCLERPEQPRYCCPMGPLRTWQIF